MIICRQLFDKDLVLNLILTMSRRPFLRTIYQFRVILDKRLCTLLLPFSGVATFIAFVKVIGSSCGPNLGGTRQNSATLKIVSHEASSVRTPLELILIIINDILEVNIACCTTNNHAVIRQQ